MQPTQLSRPTSFTIPTARFSQLTLLVLGGEGTLVKVVSWYDSDGVTWPNGRPLLIDGQHVDRMMKGLGNGPTWPYGSHQFVIIETPSEPDGVFYWASCNTTYDAVHVKHPRTSQPTPIAPSISTLGPKASETSRATLPQPSGVGTGHQGVMMGVAERTSFPLSVTCSQRVVTTLPELGWRIQPISLGICTRIFD